MAWQRDRPWYARDVLLPDGTRGTCRYSSLGPAMGWHRPEAQDVQQPEGWIAGTLAVSPDDLVFADVPVQPMAAAPERWAFPDMECDLWESAAFRALCQDRAFAEAVVGVLYDAGVQGHALRHDDGGFWTCTQRGNGWIMAGLRGRGEVYADYYGRENTPPPALRQAVVAALAGLGWHLVFGRHWDAVAAEVVRLMAPLEARPPGPAPGWYDGAGAPRNRMASTSFGVLYQRLHDLAETGRITEAEWRAVARAFVD